MEGMTRAEVLGMYNKLEARRKRLMSIQELLNKTYNVMLELYGWDIAKKVCDGHSQLSGAIFMEYYNVTERIKELIED